MLISILITLKTILYIAITNIEHNKLIILLFTTLISSIIISLIEFSKIEDKSKKIIRIIFYSAFSLIIFVDIMYYSYFQSLPSIAILGQAKQLSSVGESIRILLTIKNLIMIIDLPFVIYYILKRQKEKDYSKDIKTKVLAGLVGSFIILIGITVNSNIIEALKNQEIYSYHTTDIINTYFKQDTVNEGQIQELIKIKEQTQENSQIENKEYEGIGKGKNLIVIQIESLQNFVINLNYNNQEITPNLNKLIKDQGTVYFDEYFQLIGRGNTSDAEFVTQNSLHPSMEDFTYSQYASNTFHGLPWVLRDNGYNAWVFHGYEKDFWNRREAYVNQGFQKFLSEEDYEFTEAVGFGISDEEFFDQTLEYIKELDNIDENPFYAFIITLSSHTPYNMDEKYHVLNIKEEHKNNIVANYLQAVHYADKQIGKFIEDLKSEGLYDETVIALYGDHFGITNSMPEVFKPMEDILGEKYSFDHIMNIPLIIHIPGEEINQTRSNLGSQIDFFPTILNIMGYKNEHGLIMGKDLLNYKGYNFVSPQTIMRKGSFIDEDVIFKISQDGIFENSIVINRKTREELDVKDYRETYDKAISDINLSNIILKEDILNQLNHVHGDMTKLQLNNKSTIASEQETIDLYERYTTRDLNDLYNDKNKIVRVNVDKLSINLKSIEHWMRDNEEAHLILKTNEEDTKLLEKIKDEYPDLRHRYIAEIDDTKKHFLIERNGYKNIILNITNQEYEDEEIIDFLNLYKHYGVIMDDSRIKTGLPDKLNKIGVRAYVEDKDSGQLRLYK